MKKDNFYQKVPSVIAGKDENRTGSTNESTEGTFDSVGETVGVVNSGSIGGWVASTSRAIFSCGNGSSIIGTTLSFEAIGKGSATRDLRLS